MIYKHSKPTKFRARNQFQTIRAIVIFTCASLIFFSTIESAMAHYPMGGRTPANFWEGLLSGMGHPIIGIDHLAFVVAVGLIAATIPNCISILASFIATAMLGTGIHILSIDLPLTEIAIAFSVVAFGVMLTFKQKFNTLLLIIFAGIAGIFHGYAYGEAIIGAEMTPLLEYLVGFSAMQLFIALLAMNFVQLISNFWQNQFFSLNPFFRFSYKWYWSCIFQKCYFELR